MTTIVTPRLRVDNCYKIFSYTGEELSKTNFDHTELYEVVWKATEEFKDVKPKGVSPGRKIKQEEKIEVKKFQSFGESLGLNKQEGWGVVQPEPDKKNALKPGQHPP